jgi:hypothetical protein
MFSGLWEKSAISIAMGFAIGLLDTAGFYITAKFFLANALSKKRIYALLIEIIRLLILIGFIIFIVFSFKWISSLWLLGSAMFFSLLGKFFFIAQRFKS